MSRTEDVVLDFEDFVLEVEVLDTRS